jgi:ABC-2 type transport system ATP-binding protein
LDKVNLAVKPGEIFGIIGLSGSGKTTLLNTIVGFVEPDRGDIVVKNPKDKKDYLVSQQSLIVKEIFGFAAQHPSFYGKLTVEENLMHFASLYKIPKKQIKERCKSLIRVVGLDGSEKILGQNLSGGMQKRLDIACSLVHNPQVLILDEPTSDLDPVSREDMWALIKDINSKGTTIILASHFVNELEELCSRFAILHKTKIIEVGTPDELKTSYSKNYEIILETKSKKYERLVKQIKSKKSLRIEDANIRNKVLTLYTPNPEQTLYSLARLIEQMNEKIIDISVNRPTIRELFESVVKN